MEQSGTLAWCSLETLGHPWLAGTGQGDFSPVHWERRAQVCFSDQVFTTLSDFPYILRVAFPCVGACNGLGRLQVRAEQSPFLFPRCENRRVGTRRGSRTLLVELGEGEHHAGIRRCWSKGIFLALLFRCVSQVKFDKHSP